MRKLLIAPAALTAAADPPLDPPAMRVGSQGLWTAPNALTVEVMSSDHSCMFV